MFHYENQIHRLIWFHFFSVTFWRIRPFGSRFSGSHLFFLSNLAGLWDASSFKAPTAIWPEGDFAVRICVSEGSSEGSRIEVMYEVNREPFESLPLLRVKTLSGIKRAFEEAFHVYEFMSALDLDLYREGVIEASAA